MIDYLYYLIRCLWWFLPAYIANGAPILVKDKLAFLAKPVDFNFKFRKKPIFGRAKTWRGLLIGIPLGTLVFVFQKWLYQFSCFVDLSLLDYSQFSIFYGFLLSFGALFGDLAKSFFKRRLNIPPGTSWFPFDQIDWILGALLFSSIFYVLPWQIILIAVILGIILHLIGNYVVISLKIKNTF